MRKREKVMVFVVCINLWWVSETLNESENNVMEVLYLYIIYIVRLSNTLFFAQSCLTYLLQ